MKTKQKTEDNDWTRRTVNKAMQQRTATHHKIKQLQIVLRQSETISNHTITKSIKNIPIRKF